MVLDPVVPMPSHKLACWTALDNVSNAIHATLDVEAASLQSCGISENLSCRRASAAYIWTLRKQPQELPSPRRRTVKA